MSGDAFGDVVEALRPYLREGVDGREVVSALLHGITAGLVNSKPGNFVYPGSLGGERSHNSRVLSESMNSLVLGLLSIHTK